MGKQEDFPFNIMDVAELLHLNIRKPYSKGYYVDCPFCGDKRGKMSLSTELNSWRCNYCGEHGGMLSLYGKINNLSNSDAYKQIREILINGEFELSDNFIAKSNIESVKCEESKLADIQTIHNTYYELLNMLTLSKIHREHLKNVRGLSNEQIDELQYKSTPPFYMCQKLTERLIKKGCIVQGVPGFYKKDGYWTVKFYSKTSGILIPSRNMDGFICGMQIRLDIPIKDKDTDTNKSGAKYIWLSSAGKSMGVSSGSPVHFVGDIFARTVFITEGALKADVAHYLMNRTFVAIAGINNTTQLEAVFKALSHNGTQTIIEAADMDKYSNVHVDKGVSKIYLLAKKYGLNFRRLTWNPNYKGIDDWQLALKRKQSEKEDCRMNFKDRFIYGLCDFSAIDDEITSWHEATEHSQTLIEHLGFTTDEYQHFMNSDDETFKMYLISLQKKQRYRIYQLDFSDGKTKEFAFSGIEKLHKAGYTQPPASQYALIWDDILLCSKNDEDIDCLNHLYYRFNDDLPKEYTGRSMSPSDVIELYDENDRRYFYCDTTAGFCPVKFSPMMIKRN